MKSSQAVDSTLVSAGDDRLVADAREGQPVAFRRIMKRYNQRLYRTARGILGDDMEAEDAVQEAYLRAFEHLSEFRGESSLATWLTRIVINEALGRKRKRRPTVDIDTVDLDKPSDGRLILFPGVAANPEIEAGRNEMRRLLDRLVDDLPERFRVVFVLREMEQLTVEETAAQLGVKPETVRSRLHRARQALRLSLERTLGSTIADAYRFDGWRCDRLTDGVMAHLFREGISH